MVKTTEREEYGMDCLVCGKTATLDRETFEMPEGWGFVLRPGVCADGKPGLEPFYACPECKEDDA
jgi:hypothetical protein